MANSHKKCKYKPCDKFERIEVGQQTPRGFFCSSDHAIDWLRDRDNDKKVKATKKKHREDKQSLKTAGQYIKEAQASVNAFIRMRDQGQPCISCGATYQNHLKNSGSTIDAGHYRSRGAAGHLRFNVFNIHAQCVKCNRYGSGNAIDYRISLIKKIGIERVERIETDNSIRKFTIEYLQRIKRIFNKRTRILKTRME